MSTGIRSQSGNGESLREHFERWDNLNVPDDRFDVQVVRLSSRQKSSDMGIGLKSRSSIVGYVNEGSNCTRQYVNVVETGKRTSL
jgi:hypothetical protein